MGGFGGWVPTGGGGGATSLDGLTDVDTTTVPPSNGQALVYDSVAGLWEPGTVAGSALQLLHVRDEKASGTGGVAWTNGVWTTRVLNTVLTNEIAGASLASNEITLPAGTYEIDAAAPMYRGSSNKARLYNVTDSTTILMGSNEWAGVSGNDSQPYSVVRGRFTLAASKVVRIEHRTSGSGGISGVNAGMGVVEVYTDVMIRKLP